MTWWLEKYIYKSCKPSRTEEYVRKLPCHLTKYKGKKYIQALKVTHCVPWVHPICYSCFSPLMPMPFWRWPACNNQGWGARAPMRKHPVSTAYCTHPFSAGCAGPLWLENLMYCLICSRTNPNVVWKVSS